MTLLAPLAGPGRIWSHLHTFAGAANNLRCKQYASTRWVWVNDISLYKARIKPAEIITAREIGWTHTYLPSIYLHIQPAACLLFSPGYCHRGLRLLTMVHQCALRGCKNSTRDGREVSYFNFPRTPARRTEWKRFFNAEREDDDDLRSPPSKSTRICSEHFVTGECLRRVYSSKRF